jgi:hypothetical protein
LPLINQRGHVSSSRILPPAANVTRTKNFR